MQFLSDEWIDALDTAARSHAGLRAAARSGDLVIHQTVTGVPAVGGTRDVAYGIELRDGAVRVVRGRSPDPTVSLSTDHLTARAIARGELAAQLAFMEGRLRIGGDVRSLLDHLETLSYLDDVFGEVRLHTEW